MTEPYVAMEPCPLDCATGWHLPGHAHLAGYTRRRPHAPEPDEAPTPIDRSVALASISTDPAPPLLIDRLDPMGHTILFGTGGVGKGALASWWIVQLIREGHRVLILDYEAHPEEWSRRIASLDAGVHASDLVRHLSPTDRLAKAAETVAATCAMHKLDYVVVDSAVMACGSDPLKPEAAAEYAAAVTAIGRPVLSLAHVTKTDDMRYPFGSIFWHNLARTTWGLQGDQSGAVVLSHRKHNNYASLGRFQVIATWRDDRLQEVYEKGYGQALQERVALILAGGMMTTTEIVEALNDDEEGVPVKRATVRRVLTRYTPEIFTAVADKWGLAS